MLVTRCQTVAIPCRVECNNLLANWSSRARSRNLWQQARECCISRLSKFGFTEIKAIFDDAGRFGQRRYGDITAIFMATGQPQRGALRQDIRTRGVGPQPCTYAFVVVSRA